MDLTSGNKVNGWNSRLFDVEDVFWMRDEKAFTNLKFTECLMRNLDEKGMLYPLTIMLQSTFKDLMMKNPHKHLFPKPIDVDYKYRCVAGNNRLYWATCKGYQRVEGILVNTDEEKHEVHKLTVLNHGVDF